MVEQKITILSKMTLKEITGNRALTTDEYKAKMKELSVSQAEIAAISGEVTGFGEKSTNFGVSTYLVGSFVAQNRLTGELFKATKAYLTGGASEEIVAKFRQRAAAEDTVRFQLTVTVVPDVKSATGYTYVIQPIKTPEVINREAELLATFAALPAPKPVKGIGNK